MTTVGSNESCKDSESAPLAGRTILITRPADQAAELARPLQALGADAIMQPAAAIEPPDDLKLLDDALRALIDGKFHWAIFSSANGVRAVFERLAGIYNLKDDALARFVADSGTKLAVVGSGTAKALALFGVHPDLVPDRFDAEGIIAALDALKPDYHATRFLSFRANRGRQVLADALRARDAEYEEVVAYKSVDVTVPNPDALHALQNGRIDAAVVTSSASAKALAALFGDDARKTRWVAISPLTADAMEKCGVHVDAVAQEASMTSLVDAVARLLR